MMTTRRRTTRIIRLVALATIVAAPVIGARVETRPPRTATVDASRYLAARSPLIDKLLPAGDGGTRFVASLGGVAGMTYASSASIMLVVPIDPTIGATVELHERAHLLDAYERQAVEKIMARLPDPVPGIYAAKNKTEHFAEMAASAWSLMSMFDVTCVESVEGALADAERDVPGTAGFVARFLQIAPLSDTVTSNALMAAAQSHVAPLAAEWDSLWRRVDARRRQDGTYDAWQRRTAYEIIESQRDAWRGSGVAGAVMRLLYWPGATAAGVLGV